MRYQTLINKNPDILLIIDIFLSVSLVLSLSANVTLKTSAHIFTIRQVEKIMIRWSGVCVEKAVAHVNQKTISPGFKPLIKKPEVKSLTCVPALMFKPCLWIRFYFFKKKVISS